MLKSAVCVHLLQYSLFIFDLFLCLLTIAISFYVLSLHIGFVLSVLNIIHVLDLESVRFQTFIQLYCILLTCSISYLLFLFVDLWNVNKISISVS